MQSLSSYKKRAEYRKMIRKNYLFEQLKPKLKEIFDYVDRSGASTISIIEIKEAFQLLNIGHAAHTHMLEHIEELLANSKDSSARSDITFEDFTKLYFHLLDYSDIQHYLKDCLVLDFVDPSMFIFASDNKIINQDFSSKILDESVILQKRIEMKYSIYANNVDQNIKILKNVETECIKNYKNSPYLDSFLQYSYSLRDCWAWLGKCLEHRRGTNDFTQGLRNLMASLYENETTTDHIVKIAMTHYLVYSNHERQEVLEKLGWSYIDFTPKHHHAQLYGIVEQEENPARAAALCVFHFDFIHAYQCLANVENPSNELSFIISILQFLKEWQTNVFQDREVCGYMYHDSSRHHEETEELYKNPQDFTNEIFAGKNKPQKFESVKRDLKVVQMLCQNIKPSDPYFRAICKFIGNSEPLPDIIKDHNLSFMDRLAFAYRFFGPNALQNYIKETIEEAKEKGYLGALLLVGKNPEGFEIIQQYIDSTGDIQSIALLGVYLKLFRFPQEEFYKNLLTDYKDLMNQLGYWEDRINLQTRVMELEKSFSDPVKERKVAEQTQEQSGYAASQQCYFCKSSLAHPTLLSKLSETKKSFSSMHKYEKTRINFCPDCQKPLPNCCICLLPVSVLNPFIELQEKIKRVASKKESNPIDLDEALMYCQECKHGGHFAHIHEWFQTHTKCPVTGCGCQCIRNDYE